MVEPGSQPLNEALALVAPGTPLREGLDRILQAKHGALVIIGDDPEVLSICTGGFLLDAEFSPQRLSELAKMDGAIILAADASRIARANVHLMPKSSIPTTETGTRHRTAERVARSLDVPVITVSEAMATIAVYRKEKKHTTQTSSWLIDRASQALSTLQRFKSRFDDAVASLSRLEMEDTVSGRDVLDVLQPGEMVCRIADEIRDYLVELGDDGRMIELQMDELVAQSVETLRLIVRDYLALHPSSRATRSAKATESELGVANGMRALRALSTTELLDDSALAAIVGFAGDLDAGREPRGYRLLHRLPRVSDAIIDRIVERFGTLPAIMAASLVELEQVEGVGTAKARAVRDGLARMVEISILERYE